MSLSVHCISNKKSSIFLVSHALINFLSEMSGVIEHNSTEHQLVIVSGFKSFTSGVIMLNKEVYEDTRLII